MNTKIFDFNVSPSTIKSINEVKKRGLGYRNHELLEKNNISKKVFSVPVNSSERKLALLCIDDISWNSYSRDVEDVFIKYIFDLGYKPIVNWHPSLLINSFDVLNEQVFASLGMQWFASILLIHDLQEAIDQVHKDCVFSIQRNLHLFGLHKRIFSEEDSYIVEKV